ncbi:hypothetical protein GRF29_19g2949046 [Pseudopithomyces chartarum]|uniref:Uncharacterized protein n=1 Tax=Pseudopithomyces chartarum TaxID=1892770 RepID=A0AAN6M4Z7_9PLEO|nr:hypothetical protein GRF29_19g2949046 [Pseudopithomyces chartarum]
MVNFSREEEEFRYYGQVPILSIEVDEEGEVGDDDYGEDYHDGEDYGDDDDDEDENGDGSAENTDWDDSVFTNEPGEQPDPRLTMTTPERIAAEERRERERQAAYDAELHVPQPTPNSSTN